MPGLQDEKRNEKPCRENSKAAEEERTEVFVSTKSGE